MSQILKSIKNQKLLVILLTLLGFGITAYFLNVPAQKHEASSIILIQADGKNSLAIQKNILNIEAAQIQSASMALKLIRELQLNDQGLDKREKKNAINQILSRKDKEEASNNFSIREINKENEAIKSFYDDPQTRRLVKDILENLNVRKKGSAQLEISYTSDDPVKAVLVTNTLTDLYLKNSQNDFQQINRQSQRITKREDKNSDWYEDRLKALEENLQNAEKNYIAASQKFDEAQQNNPEAYSQKNIQALNELQRLIIKAKAEEAEAKASLQILKRKIKSSGNSLLGDAYQSDVLTALKIREAEMLREISQLSLKYGSKYPAMIEAKATLTQLRQQMAQEVENIVERLETKEKLARKRITYFEEIEKRLSDTTDTPDVTLEINLKKSQSNYQQAQNALDRFLSNIKPPKNIVQPKISTSELKTSIISYASLPLASQNTLHKIPPLFLGGILSFLIASLIAVIKEKSGNTYRTVEELEEETNLPCFSLVPNASIDDKPSAVADYIIRTDSRRAAEATRSLRMMMKLKAEESDQLSKVITVTSSLSGEGKTTLSAWMARISAKSGERVMLVDCDLRRPSLHEAFGKKPQNDLVEYLTGKCSLEEAIYRDPATNMHALFARPIPNNALDMITKDNMSKLIQDLRKQYDLVVLDTPALLSVSDSRILAAQSDQTIYVVSWDDTRREVVNAGLKQFAQTGQCAVTLVLNNVDLKRYSKYSSNDAIHYYSAYNSYYEET